MASTTVSTEAALIAALAAYGSGDTIYVADGTYTFTAGLEKTSGGMPSIIAVNAWQPIFRWTKTYSWTADGAEYYCVPDKAGGSHTPYEQPWGLWSPTGAVYRQARSGFFPYDYAAWTEEPDEFNVTAAFPTPDNTADFHLMLYVRHDILPYRGSVAGSTVTVTNLLNEAVAGGTSNSLDWMDNADHQVLTKRGYCVMNREADMRPGTWRWDSALGRLYVMPLPGETINNLRVPIDVRKGIRVDGQDSFNIAGIIGEGLNPEPHCGAVGFSDDGFLVLSDCEDVGVNVRVRNTAGCGIRMKIATDPPGNGSCPGARINSCHLENVGGQGIVFGGDSSNVTGNTVINAGSRLWGAPAIVGEFVRSARVVGNTTRNCGGGSLHIAADNDDAATGPYVANHRSIDDMTNQLGDRGNMYFIGRDSQGGVEAIVTGQNWFIHRRTTNGSGDHGVYFDEGSYGTITNLRIKGFGSQLGWYNSTKTNITPGDGAYDAYSGRTIFWNNPDGPTVINGGTLVGDIVTLDVRTSAQATTINGVKVFTTRGLKTNGTVDRTGEPGVPAPPP